VFYIHSDNGASAEGMFGTIAELLAQNGVDYPVEQQIEVLERDYGGLDALGTPLVDNMYHHGWAWATDTPLRSTKLIAAHFGGTRTPMVVSWPERVEPDPTPRTQFHHVIDVAATIYDVLGIEPPSEFNGVAQDPLDGDSMVPAFAADDREGGRATQYFEVMGSRGVYHQGWFAGAFGPKRPWVADMSGLAGWDPDEDEWELYHLDDDYSQARNLAEEHPQKLRELQDMFTIQAARNKVFPIGGGLYMAYHPEEGRGSTLIEWTFHPGQVRIPESLAPKYTSGFSTLATIDVELDDGDEGVLFAVGGIAGGFTVFVDGGHLKAEYNMLGVERYKAASAEPLAPGHHQLEVEVRFDEQRPQAPATLTLRIDGADVGSTRIERSVQAVFTASETFDVGIDLGSPVALDYHERAPFEFTGTIERLHITYL
jgi:arylsulfatase